jgi:hypothetical protein
VADEAVLNKVIAHKKKFEKSPLQVVTNEKYEGWGRWHWQIIGINLGL